MPNEYGRTVNVRWVPAILSQITSHVEEVAVHLLFNTNNNIDPLDWNAFSKIFAQPHFSRLRKLEFRVGGPAAIREELAVAIRRRLPECDTRGILSVAGYD